MNVRYIAILLLAISLTACASNKIFIRDPSVYRDIKIIILKDKTDPVLLRATGAGLVSELFEIALSAKGYVVCKVEDCEADAVATVRTTDYYDSERLIRGQYGIPAGGSVKITVLLFNFTLQKTKTGELLINTQVGGKQSMPLNQATSIFVQKLASYIPPAAKQ